MAKKQTELTKLMNGIRKITDSTSFENSSYGEIDGYIDTGVMSLNRIISGSVYNGIPKGRTILLGGESGVGKSLIAAQITRNALTAGFKHVFYFDSEGGALKKLFKNIGCDLDRIEHVLVNTVEDTTVKVNKLYDSLLEHKKENPDDDFLIIIDSIGNLVTEKFYNDALVKGVQVTDMGLRARGINNLMQSTTMPALKSNVSLIAINHIYDDPGSMYTQKIKCQSGGKKLQYVATINIQCTKSLDKGTNDEAENGYYNGSLLKFFTVKNRLVKPFLEADMYIDFSKGIKKWDGLLEPAIKYGFITQHGAYYTVPSYSDKKYHKSKLLTMDDAWQSFIDAFNEKSMKETAYSSVISDSEIENLELSDTEV